MIWLAWSAILLASAWKPSKFNFILIKWLKLADLEIVTTQPSPRSFLSHWKYQIPKYNIPNLLLFLLYRFTKHMIPYDFNEFMSLYPSIWKCRSFIHFHFDFLYLFFQGQVNPVKVWLYFKVFRLRRFLHRWEMTNRILFSVLGFLFCRYCSRNLSSPQRLHNHHYVDSPLLRNQRWKYNHTEKPFSGIILGMLGFSLWSIDYGC